MYGVFSPMQNGHPKLPARVTAGRPVDRGGGISGARVRVVPGAEIGVARPVEVDVAADVAADPPIRGPDLEDLLLAGQVDFACGEREPGELVVAVVRCEVGGRTVGRPVRLRG